jgi:hypothetical protein
MPLVKHILKPGICFWGLSSQLSEDAVKSEIHELLDRPVLEIISASREARCIRFTEQEHEAVYPVA